MKSKLRKVFSFLRREDANTAEENSNRGAWWIAAILLIVLVIGVLWFVVGNLLSTGQKNGLQAANSVTTQQGLDALSTQAESGSGGFAGSAQTSGSFQAP